MLSWEFAFCLFINYVYIHVQVDARVYDGIWKKQFSAWGNREQNIQQALKVYCGTGVIKGLLFFSFVNSSIFTNKNVKRIYI